MTTGKLLRELAKRRLSVTFVTDPDDGARYWAIVLDGERVSDWERLPSD
jgi:hypothetical protein